MNKKRSHILIVDDIPANLRLLVSILQTESYNVRVARSGSTALISAQAAPPDLILLDIKMPEMDGYEVCQHLKADERTKHIPVIFISAVDELVNKVKAFEVGGVDYITKPLQNEEVLARVQTHLHLQDMKIRLESQNAQLAQTSEHLQRQNATLKAQQKASVDAILVVDEHRRVTYYNQHFLNLWNIPPDLANSRDDNTLIEFVAPQFQSPDAFLEEVEYLYEHSNEVSYDEIVLKDGRMIERCSAPMIVPGGKRYGRVWYFRDISKRKQAEIALKERNAELQALFAGMTDLVIMLDRDGNYLKVAPTSPELLYKPADELIGKRLHQTFSRELADIFLSKVQESLDTKKTVSIEYSLDIANKTLWFDGRVSPMSDKAVVFVARDITERKHTEEQLQKAKEAAEAANRAKSAFLANVSHELRTPLNAILGFTQMMEQDESFPEKHQERLKIINKSGKHLLGLINTIIKMSKTETATVPSLEKMAEPDTNNQAMETFPKQDILTAINTYNKTHLTVEENAIEQHLDFENLQSQIKQLPSDLPITLAEATELSDMEMIDSAIETIRTYNSSLADVLGMLANNFEYDRILALIERE